MEVDWGRLLIRTQRPDVPEMLGFWEWLVGRDMHPLVMTKFGDWFLADPDGHVHWLDLLEGSRKPVADSVSAFERLMVQPEQLDNWFVLPWCYRLHDEGHVPGENQCFGFKVPPKLGANVDLSNVEVADLKGYQFWMAEVAKVPPGAEISHVTVNGMLP